MKWQVDKVASRQNGKLTKWQDDNTECGQNGWSMKWQVDKESPADKKYCWQCK